SCRKPPAAPAPRWKRSRAVGFFERNPERTTLARAITGQKYTPPTTRESNDPEIRIPNDDLRKNHEAPNPKRWCPRGILRHSDFGFRSAFVIRLSSFSQSRRHHGVRVSFARKCRRDRASAHDSDAIAHSQNFREFGRDHQYGQTLRRQPA